MCLQTCEIDLKCSRSNEPIVFTCLGLGILGIILLIIFTIPNYDQPYNSECGFGYNNTQECVCYKFYRVYNNFCSVRQKSRRTAGLLQTFYGFAGAGFAYIGNWALFIFQICVFIVFLCCFMTGYYGHQNINEIKAWIFGCVCVGILTWMTSMIMMWANYYKDQDGFPLV